MILPHPEWLRVAYLANILILVPICSLMFAHPRGAALVFQGAVADSAGLRLLVASLWCAILIASAAGLVWPAFFAPVVLIQLIYKTLWLVLFVAPLVARGAPAPWGVATTFAAIILTYPVLLWLAARG